MKITPIIMAGGSGTRLWPLSRRLHPKQFLALTGQHSMLQQTLTRLEGLPCEAPIIICNEEHRFLVAEQLRDIGVQGANILLEPEGRNTAPAIALGALQAEKRAPGQQSLLLILAADHVIEDIKALHEAVKQASPLASDGSLVTFGILPTHAETGYGYIQQGTKLDMHGYRVEQFVEKPDSETAEQYIASGNYLWNSGMFLMRPDAYLEALKRQAPAILTSCEQAMAGAQEDLDFVRIDKWAFLSSPSDSVDYAVMEKESQVAVVPLDAGWSDVGSWSALWDVSKKDRANNVRNGDVILENTQNCLVHSSHRLVATVGVENLIIVETKDAVLVVSKQEDQRVKQVVEQLKQNGRSELSAHREVYRPWGKYDSVDMSERYQVKRITVNPGQKLSIQMHHHRAEHWIVVSGTARVGINDEEMLLSENQSVYIPLGAKHFLENPGKIPLEVIEVQSGAYLGEDDIVRFEDVYGRSKD
ncbi:mannose-1-phosphate guanylyltransferase/mannose-6-phosphate isomerase [Vreelandella olivaria]|uniref:mannose-1-phosphate guanylyltransferase/mannose-6-phosphate isomerase n=1 Tax=Vreelandella olivaria TaxID=390919 RepID=UPI00201F46A8|nr:mannose-1-phosphate guanylyltransferase/mannose-6-phosphate isomerase [Halomonas olivaria]